MMLSKVNRKLGLIDSFNITTNLCCKISQSEHCYRNYCYAKRLEKLYPNFARKNIRNYKLSLKDSFVSDINKELVFDGRYIRVHSSGEFYSQDYVDKWIFIARSNNDKTFYSYTKRYDLDFSKRPDNFIVYLSDDLLKLEQYYDLFDGVAYIKMDKKEKTKKGFSICKNQIDKSIKCSDCLRCTRKGEMICFIKH